MDQLERDLESIARELAAAGGGSSAGVFRLSFWSDRVLQQAMERPEFRDDLFRLVDVLPATQGPRT